ncbi:MAG: RagB/SusD family nutrient uptake outer membrane protein [Petrimonas sp.]|nr:RagB/SusD family nutrient uptake outer membrane protein [Petrimonas sp.]
MKKLLSTILIALTAASLTSCYESLDEANYTYAVATLNFYNTPEEANAAVMAPLNYMRSSYDANWFATLEINTEYGYPKGVYSNYTPRYEGLINATHVNRIATNWDNLYRSILYCNIAIDRLPEANAMTTEEINAYIGELRFLRALNYFNLVRNWGGVPLRTEENMETWDLAKSPVNEVYNLIIEDLKFAIGNVPAKPRLVGTPGVNACKSLLSEVYMYTEDYKEALRLSSEVIDSKEYSLVPVTSSRDFDKVFGYDLVTSSEEVFYIKTSRTDGKTWNYVSYTAHPKYEIEPGLRMLNGNGYYTHYTDLRNKVIENWDRNDLRYGLNIGFYVFGADAYGEYTCLFTKFWDPLAQGSGANVSIPLIRYPDVLITFAEASARVNNNVPTEQSMEAINKLRRRAYGFNPEIANAEIDYKLSDYNTMDKFIDLLIREETYERMNEAKHWNFTVRLGKAQELVGAYSNVDGDYTEIKEKHYLWKIPDAEFNYNKAMDQKRDQNPGYTTED